MTKLSHNHIFDICRVQKHDSDDLHTQVGICVVDQQGSIRAVAANTFPRGVRLQDERLERPEKYFWMEHAERNCFYYAARVGLSLEGCTIYLLGLPCMDCARGIIQVGISRVIVHYESFVQWNTPKYQPDFLRVETMLNEAGVGVSYYDTDICAFVDKQGTVLKHE